MTLNELKTSALSLGFEDGFDDDEIFSSATERALYTLYIDRPRTRAVGLTVLSNGGRLVHPAFIHTGGGVEEFSVSGRAYSFRVSGTGSYVIREGGAIREESFDSRSGVVRGFINGDATVSFTGEYDYAVFSFATYNHRFSPSVTDIPLWLEAREINLSSHFPDFMAPESLPKDKSGKSIEGAAIKDGTLYLPFGYTGDITLEYRRKPAIPTFDDPDEVIDISEECVTMLPLLVASYVWLDDDREKSEYYLSLYKDILSTLMRRNSRVVESEYMTNGWA